MLTSPVELQGDANRTVQPRLPKGHTSHTRWGKRSVVCAGVGGPSVVFESGLGSGKEAWESVFNEVAAHTHAVACDRAGYGKSDSATRSRDLRQMVRELRAMLQEEEIRPPYVLVGHSLGGMLVKLFARAYPGEVAGVVLVDARHSDFSRFCRGVGVPRFLYEPPAALLLFARAVLRGELKAAALGAGEIRRAGPFPPVPVSVLTHRKWLCGWPASLGRIWGASQRNMAKMSGSGRLVMCEGSGHNVHLDRPDAVVQEVLGVVAAARAALAARLSVRG
jgi:pimeloyl-ACP methyl ester carboxylesterase